METFFQCCRTRSSRISRHCFSVVIYVKVFSGIGPSVHNVWRSCPIAPWEKTSPLLISSQGLRTPHSFSFLQVRTQRSPPPNTFTCKLAIGLRLKGFLVKRLIFSFWQDKNSHSFQFYSDQETTQVSCVKYQWTHLLLRIEHFGQW